MSAAAMQEHMQHAQQVPQHRLQQQQHQHSQEQYITATAHLHQLEAPQAAINMANYSIQEQLRAQLHVSG
jgi:hypothetical protein